MARGPDPFDFLTSSDKTGWRDGKVRTPLRAAADFGGPDQDLPDTAGMEDPVRSFTETQFIVLVSGAICFVALRAVVVSDGRLEALTCTTQ